MEPPWFVWNYTRNTRPRGWVGNERGLSAELLGTNHQRVGKNFLQEWRRHSIFHLVNVAPPQLCFPPVSILSVLSAFSAQRVLDKRFPNDVL